MRRERFEDARDSVMARAMLCAAASVAALASVAIAGEEDAWPELATPTGIVAGSALDFSQMCHTGNGRAGELGRVIATNGHFAFERRPERAVRFFGVNTVGDMNTPTRDAAERFAEYAARVGYNALRIHHHDDEITRTSPDGTTLDLAAMDKLDALCRAAIDKGLYLTTDLFVSRRHIPYRECGIDKDGFMGIGEFKSLVQFHEGVSGNFMAFARNFLLHRNIYTGKTYAEEPALAFISLVNEGALTGFAREEFLREGACAKAWREWLERRKFDDINRDIPLDAPGGNSRDARAFRLFLAESEMRFVNRMKGFLRDELGCHALITDMNGVHHPEESQLARQLAFDYVDEHFYVGGPWFYGGGWNVPSRSRLAHHNHAKEIETLARRVVFHRVMGKPFVASEFNYPSPDDWRAAGGMIVGALSAAQDWDGLWRFAWSHGKDGLEDISRKGMYYMDVVSDPMMLASERAIASLFLRGDKKPFKEQEAIGISKRRVAKLSASDNGYDDASTTVAWEARTGSALGDADAKPEGKRGGNSSGDGEIKIDPERGTFIVSTLGTCGGFGPKEATIKAGALAAHLKDDAVIWVAALDGKEISKSKRMLLSHLTDVRQTGMVFKEMGIHGRDLLDWGHLPLRVRPAVAEVRLGVAADRYEVYALSWDGTRICRIDSKYDKVNGVLSFVASVRQAKTPAPVNLYEIVSVQNK